MVAIGISEFTFGYAFLFEQTQRNWANLKAAPILPSLYQFRGNASYLRDGTFNKPYYRFTFHSRDNYRQHRRLRELAASNANTYYVAPEFNDLPTFNAIF